jgi:hypothetical protein
LQGQAAVITGRLRDRQDGAGRDAPRVGDRVGDRDLAPVPRELRGLELRRLGSAQALGQSCGQAEARVRSRSGWFIAPEQVKCDPVTVRTDVYNFGATLYWALTSTNVPTPNSADTSAWQHEHRSSHLRRGAEGIGEYNTH